MTKPDGNATDKWYKQVAEVRAALGRIVKQEAIEPWLWSQNESFGCRPIDMIGTHREHEIYQMIDSLESGEPT